MLEAIARELRHIVYAVAAIAAVCVWGYIELHRPVAPAAPVSSTSTETRLGNVEREMQGVVQGMGVIAAAHGSVPAYAAPAIRVACPPGFGFTGAACAQIFAGLKPPTVTKIGANLVGPKPTNAPTAPPGWTDAQIHAMTDADVAATERVLADPQTHIAVTVTQEERPPTRIGSMFTPDGSGLGFAAARRGHFEIDIGAIVRGSHLSPVLSPEYLIPHTSVAIGPFVGYDKQLLYGAAATVHF